MAWTSTCLGLVFALVYARHSGFLVKQNHECLAFPFPQRSQSFFYQSREDYQAYLRRALPAVSAAERGEWSDAVYDATPWESVIREVHSGAPIAMVWATTIAYAVLLCSEDREAAVLTTLDRIVNANVSIPQTDVHLFLACPHLLSPTFTAKVKAAYPQLPVHTVQSRFPSISLAADSRAPQSYRLTATYDFVFVHLLTTLKYGYVAIVEDDLLVSEFFTWFLKWGRLVLEVNPDLLAVTAWNDNAAESNYPPTSFGSSSASTLPPPLPFFVQRTSHFQGLGWLISRNQFVRHLLPLWMDWAPHIQWDYLPFAAVLLSRAAPPSRYTKSLYEGKGWVDLVNRLLDESPRGPTDVSSHCSAKGRASDLSAKEMEERWKSLPSAAYFPPPNERFPLPLSCLSPSIPMSHHLRTKGRG